MLLIVHHQQSTDTLGLHHMQSLTCQFVGMNGFGLRAHHAGHRNAIDVVAGLQNAAQVTIGNHAQGFLLGIHHRRHAKTFGTHLQNRRF